MTYEEYKEARKNQVREFINAKLIHLQDHTSIEGLLRETAHDYEMHVLDTVQELYQETNLTPELYELERFIPKIKDKVLKHRIADHFFYLDLLYETIYEMTMESDENNKENITIEECLEKIPEEKRTQAISILQKYLEKSGETPQYIGSGESCTAFKIGNKIVKFGSKRRYPNIPYCLDIHDEIQYAPYQFMYITDAVDTNNISSLEAEAMYRVLRDQGYVWVDVKPDNIGKYNGKLKILDDVDIYTEQDALSQHRKSTTLEFVSYNINLAILEIKWLQSKNPTLTIDDIDQYFQNQSTQTKEEIDRIKDAYTRQTKTYTFDPNIPYYQTFGNILERKIAAQNATTTTQSKESVTLQ